jgi:large repetitive protein
VTVDGRPRVVIDKSGVTQCAGVTSFTFNAEVDNAPNYFWWSPSGQNIVQGSLNGNKSTITYSPTQQQLGAGHFWINLKGSNGGKCAESRDSIYVAINPLPQPSFNADNVEGCDPFTTTFHAGNNQQLVSVKYYIWNWGDGTIDTSTVKDIKHTFVVPKGQNVAKYTVKLTEIAAVTGCTNETTTVDYITVDGTPLPRIFANPQFTTVAMPDIQFDVDGSRSIGVDFKDPNTSYFWTFGDSGKDHPTIRAPKHSYRDTGIFMVHLYVSSKSCQGQDSLPVVIKPELIIFIPNVFKPNGKHGRGHPGDNYFSTLENETFQPVIGHFSTFEMNVYNRWGELMYNTKDPLKGWNGVFQGEPALEGVYVYVVKATGYSGKPYTFTGTVTLLR